MRFRLFRTVALGAALAAPGLGSAQLSPVPAGTAVAGAYLSLAKGHEALWVNPANLAGKDVPSVTLGLGGGFGLSALGLDLKQVQTFVDAGNFGASEKAQILAKIPDAGTNIRGQVFVPALTLQLGRLAAGVGFGAAYDHNLGKDLVDLALNGYDQGRVNYKVGNTTGRQAWWIDAAVGYGQRFGPLQLGVTGHYIVPQGLYNSRLYEPTYDLVNRTIAIQGYAAGASGGSGYSVDVGGTVNLGLVTVSAVLQNAAGNVTWETGSMEYRGIALNNDNIEEAGEVIAEAFGGKGTRLTPDAPLGAIQAAQGVFTKAFFPRTLRVGGHLRLPVLGTRVSAQYNNQLQDGFLGGFWRQSVSVGLAQKFWFLTPSVGYAQSTDPTDGSMLSGGLGLGPLNVSVAQLRDGTVNGTRREGFLGAVGLTIGF